MKPTNTGERYKAHAGNIVPEGNSVHQCNMVHRSNTVLESNTAHRGDGGS